MKHPLKLSSAVLASVACWAFASSACAQEAPKPRRGADVAAVDQAPEAKKYLGGKPGGQEKVARTFKEQPPVIPHAVENFDDTTLEENQSLTPPSAANYHQKTAPK